jgi:hypothetical protein
MSPRLQSDNRIICDSFAHIFDQVISIVPCMVTVLDSLKSLQLHPLNTFLRLDAGRYPFLTFKLVHVVVNGKVGFRFLVSACGIINQD